MGAAAFLMIEFLGLPIRRSSWRRSCRPSCISSACSCRCISRPSAPACAGCRAELPDALEVIQRDWPTVMPLMLLIVLFSGFTPYLAAFWGITACIVVVAPPAGHRPRVPGCLSVAPSRAARIPPIGRSGLRGARSCCRMFLRSEARKRRGARPRRCLRSRREVCDRRWRRRGNRRHHRRHVTLTGVGF